MKRNKGLLIAGALSTVGAIVGSGLLYKKFNNKENEKYEERPEEFNVLKLQDEEYAREAIRQLDVILEDLYTLEQFISEFIDDIKGDLVIRKPLTFANKVSDYKDSFEHDKLNIILLKKSKTSELVEEAKEFEDLKIEMMKLNVSVLRAYTTSNQEKLNNTNLDILRLRAVGLKSNFNLIIDSFHKDDEVEIIKTDITNKHHLNDKLKHKLILGQKMRGRAVHTETVENPTESKKNK